ncbi:MAG: very short patch repair endonuclease [Candidatus Zixiibacteriota bacterium]
MPDVFTKKKRSEVMSRIRGSGNKETELELLQLLRKNRISGWRRNYPLVGKPDFSFPKFRVALFVDGCFWHGCPQHSNMPVNNRQFWRKKLTSNKQRDKIVNSILRKKGWKIVRIWEHQLHSNPVFCVRKIRQKVS